MLLKVVFITFLSILPIDSVFAISSRLHVNQELPSEALQAEVKGEWEKAISIYTDLLLIKPDKLIIWLRIAQIEQYLKNYNLAANAYKHAIKIQPHNSTFHKALSEIYAEMDKPRAALIEIRKAAKLDPKNIDYWVALAKLANWNKKTRLALASYQMALTLGKNSQKSAFNKNLFISIARLQAELKNYPQAIENYNQAMAIQPVDDFLYQELADSYIAQKKWADALVIVNRALEFKKENVLLLQKKASLESRLEKQQEALKTYQKILDASQEDVSLTKSSRVVIFTQISDLQNQSRNFPKAIAALEQAIKLKPNDANLYLKLSQIYAAAQKPGEALQAIDKALAIDKNNVAFLRAKAILAMWLKNEKLAVKTYQEILRLLPKDTWSREGLKGIEKNALALKNSNPRDIIIAESDMFASQGKYKLAIEALRKALIKWPSDARIYQKLSELFSVQNNPKMAQEMINRAIALQPENIRYLKAKAQLASWLDNPKAMEQAYAEILRLQPRNKEAMQGFADALRWQGRTDDAILAYESFLIFYPNDANVWLDYAEVLSWTENYIGAFSAIEQYKNLAGETEAYKTKQARFLALADRYDSALKINGPLLKNKPKDLYLLSTEVTALVKAYQRKRALNYLKKINELYKNDPQVIGLNAMILTPFRANISPGADYISASDTTKILSIPLAAQYYLSPTTGLIFRSLYERATAALGSGLETINGQESIFDSSAMLGVTTQIASWFNVSALAGGLDIQNENHHGIYEVNIMPNIAQASRLVFTNLYNLYRPYLVPQSPRSISLQIMESRNSLVMDWQPFVQKYLNVVVSHSDLSDTNAYWHYNLWPKARVYGSESWKITLGANADIWQYKKRLNNGYYDPLNFNGYEATIETYYIQSENVGYSVWGGFGMQKDETFPHYYYEEDLGLQAFFGLYTDWELRLKSGYTLRKNPTGNYHAWSVGLLLTRRF